MSSGTQQWILAFLAALILVPLGAIAILQAVDGKPFSEPQGLEALAGVVITFFFAHGSFLAMASASGAQMQTLLSHSTEVVATVTGLNAKSNSTTASPSSDTTATDPPGTTEEPQG